MRAIYIYKMHIHVIKIQITFLMVDKLPDSGEKSAKYIKNKVHFGFLFKPNFSTFT